MARRILEEKLRETHGKGCAPMGTAGDVSVIREIKLHATYRGVYSLQFDYTGDILAVGYGSGGIQLFESATGNQIKELRSCRQGGNSVMALRFHPKVPDILYAATTDGTIFVYNCATCEEVAHIEEAGNEINCLDFSVDGFNFATGGKDLNIRVYETKSNKEIHKFEGYGNKTAPDSKQVSNTMRVFALIFHPDNEYIFLTGGWDNHIKIWDVRSNDGIKRNIRGPHICGDAIDMQQNTVLSGQWTALHALQEFNYTDGSVVRELKYPHTDGAFLYCAQYCNKDMVVAGGSGTNCANFIRVSTNSPVGQLKLGSPVQAVDTAKDGRLAAVGGAGSSIFIVKVSEK